MTVLRAHRSHELSQVSFRARPQCRGNPQSDDKHFGLGRSARSSRHWTLCVQRPCSPQCPIDVANWYMRIAHRRIYHLLTFSLGRCYTQLDAGSVSGGAASLFDIAIYCRVALCLSTNGMGQRDIGVSHPPAHAWKSIAPTGGPKQRVVPSLRFGPRPPSG